MVRALIFSGSIKPSSLMIQLVTGSKWSHVSVLMDTGEIIDATGSLGVARRKVPRIPFGGWAEAVYMDVISPGELAHATGALEQQVGKKYDEEWLLDYVFKQKGRWQDADKWVCSELVWYAFPSLRKKKQNRAAPKHIYKAIKELTGG